MIRRWTPQDFPAIAQAMLVLKKQCIWRDEPGYDVDEEDFVKWLMVLYVNELTTAFVNEEEGVITAIAGVVIYTGHLPPHFKQMMEWCLWGDSTRSISPVWRAAQDWGRKRGVVYSQRSTFCGAKEYIRWEKLT